MRKDRNSYSETNLEPTFMRMKEDHMLNGQLKPAYNVQIAAENYFIIHGYVSSDRTDYNTLIPVLQKHQKAFGELPEEVTADSGYSSERNLLYLKENQIASYIKLQDHEKRKTRSIQTGGHFGDIKENEDFRRFNYRSSEKVYKEFMLYAIGQNINKYHRFVHGKLQKFEGKSEQKSA